MRPPGPPDWPLELLEYDVDVETAGGHTKAARLTLDRLAVGRLVERSVPALVVPHGQIEDQPASG